MTRPTFKPQKSIDPELPKAAVRRLVEQNGGAKHVAVKLGFSGETLVYAYADPNEAAEITFARVAALTSPEAPAAVEYLAQLAHGVFVPVPQADSDLGLLTAESITQHGEAAAELVRALKDGRLGDDERAGAVTSIDEALRVLVQLRAAVAKERAD